MNIPIRDLLAALVAPCWFAARRRYYRIRYRRIDAGPGALIPGRMQLFGDTRRALGPGSVVRGTVPAGVVAIGTPAKVARTFNDAACTVPRPGPSSGPAGSMLIPQTPGRPR